MSDNNNVTLNDEDARKKFKVGIDQIVGSMTRQAAEAEQIKETIKAMKEEFSIKPKVIRAIAKAAYKCDFNEIREEYNEILELYETVMDT